MKILSTEDELTEALHLTVKSVYAMHPLYKILPPHPEEVTTLLKYMITESNRHQTAWGYYVGGKMVGFVLSFPAREYLRLSPPNCPRSMLIQYMRPFEKKIDKDFEEYLTSKNETSQSVMCEWFAIDPEFEGKDMGLVMWYHSCKLLHELGWRYSYGVSSNPASLRLCYMFFAEVIADVTIPYGPLEGKQLQLTRIDIKECMSELLPKDIPGFSKL